jgi:AraC family ethanolamine operon transcriptional activator
MDVDLGPVRVLREFTSCKLHQLGALRADHVAMGVPRSIAGTAMFCGSACRDDHVIVFSGMAPFEFVSPGGMDIADFVVDRDYLDGFLTGEEHEALRPQLGQPHLRTASAAGKRRLPALLADVHQVLDGEPGAAADAARVAGMARDIATGIAAVLVEGLNREAAESLPYQRRARIVSRARERVVASGADGSLTVEGLCRELAVSRRALQYSFQEVLGLSPLAYLRAVRLNGARRAIKQCSSVSDAATAWGFWHFGRFAQDYRALFGELPSQTFKRFH